MNIFIKHLLLITMFLTSAIVHAGSRGYSVAFYDVSAPEMADGVDTIMQLRKSEVEVSDCYICERDGDSEGGDVSILAVNIKPAISAALIKRAVSGHRQSVAAVQKQLVGFRDGDYYSDGLDGIYVYERSQGKVRLYALSSRKGSCKVRSAERVVHRAIVPEKFDEMLRTTSAAFACGFAP